MELIINLEEVDELMPSRELDAYIAENYLGRKVLVIPNPELWDNWYEVVQEYRISDTPFDLSIQHDDRLPFYTSKIKDSWLLDSDDFYWLFAEEKDKLIVTLKYGELNFTTTVFWDEIDVSSAYALARCRCIIKLQKHLLG